MTTLVPLAPAERGAWREAAIERRAARHTTPLTGDEAAGLARARSTLTLGFPEEGDWGRSQVLAVEDERGRRGVVALGWDSEHAAYVADLDLDDPADAPEVRGLCEASVAPAGATSLAIRVSPGCAAETAFAADPGFTVVASNLVLDLSAPPPPQGPVAVELRPMSEAYLATYFETTVEDFAAETRRAEPSLGHEESIASARWLYEQLLPQGAATPGHDFLEAVDASGTVVGMTWLFSEGVAGFVYDVVVEETHRGRGLGRALMVASADRLRGHGQRVLGLNVFGHNTVARHLYDSLGYRVVDEVRVTSL